MNGFILERKLTYILIRSSFLVWILFILTARIIAGNGGNSLNGKKIHVDSTGNYSFFVSGHFHGSSQNTTGKPAKTLLKNISRINNENVSFLVSLGDIFLDVKNDIPTYRELFIDKLKMPLYNVPGNHDKSGNVYEENFGATFYYFKLKSELFIFLDTEMDDGSITEEQLEMLRQAFSSLKDVKNIFIFGHRLIWAEEHPMMKHLFTDNTRSGNGNNFRKEILPLLSNAGRGKHIFIMGGSLGNAPSPFFYHKDDNIIYIATAIRDTPKDAFLKVKVIEGDVTFYAFPLIMPIEFYNLDYYNGLYQKVPGFNWRLIPLYIKNMLLHRYFWYGVLMIFLTFAIYRIIRKPQKKDKI